MAVTLPFCASDTRFLSTAKIGDIEPIEISFKKKNPFFALSLISSVLTLLAQNSSASNVTPLKVVALPARILLAFKALIAYIGKMIWPAELIPLYKHPVRVSVLSLEYLPAIIFMRCNYDLMYYLRQKTAGLPCCLGILCYFVVACTWDNSGRQTGNGRQIYVSSEHWAIPACRASCCLHL